MKTYILALFVALLFLTCSNPNDKNPERNEYAVIAYFQARDTVLNEKNIKASKLTHINPHYSYF